MPGHGFVRSELEIKTLTLHVLSYINMPVTFDELMQMVFVDDAINYFNFADYLDGMVKTEHVAKSADVGVDRYEITPKGLRDLNAIRSSVPGSVLRKAEKACDNMRDALIRKNLVSAKIVEDGDKFRAVCSLSDESGEVFSFSMTASSHKAARELTTSFYKNAEQVYNDFLTSLLSKRD